MTYQVLARKWRPTNFSEVAGQKHVLQSLINALDKQRLHHAYLFTGTRGVGKTTLARILAKCLNCESGISSTPCGECDACREINEGRFVDLIEVDAASRTKVEDTRELLENVQYTPARGRFKVYLIDEVHMLSTHSFNALLKTLEEPPEHAKFLFATTDPQKLPVTILSRCLQFNLKNLSPAIIVEQIKTILGAEEIDFEEPALWQIAMVASGSMRDALTLTDQAIGYCEGRVSEEGVIEMLGVPQQRQIYEILAAMARMDALAVLQRVEEMAAHSPDFTQSLDSLLYALHRIALAQVSAEAVDNSFGDRQQIIDLAASLSAEDVQLFYQIGNRGRDELRMADDLRPAFEMLLLRMLLFSPTYTEPASAESGASGDKQAPAAMPEQKKKPEPTVTLAPTPAEPDLEPETQPEPVLEAEPALHPEPAAASSPDPRPEPASEAEPRPVATTASSATDLQDPGALTAESWLLVFPQLAIKGMAANVLANTTVRAASGERLALLLDDAQSAIYNEDLLPKFEQALADYFGRAIAVDLHIGSVEAETPARQARRLRQERHEQMVAEFQQDENVQEILRRFSGHIVPESISRIEE